MIRTAQFANPGATPIGKTRNHARVNQPLLGFRKSGCRRFQGLSIRFRQSADLAVPGIKVKSSDAHGPVQQIGTRHIGGGFLERQYPAKGGVLRRDLAQPVLDEIGRASCRERVKISVYDVSLLKVLSRYVKYD